MDQQRTYQLFLKHLRANLSAAEKKELEAGLREIDQHTFDSWVNDNVNEHDEVEFLNQEQVFDRIWGNIDPLPIKNSSISPWYKQTVFQVAAACAVMAFGLLFFIGDDLLHLQQKGDTMDKVAYAHGSLELPEENALVTLADGTQMLFDALNTDTLRHKGLEITRSNEGVLVMRRKGESDIYFDENDRHKLSAPKGVALHVLLPDSTSVWLNSGSTITLYASFGKNDRRVELQGEGFFEVSHDQHKPFIVKAKNSVVQVLGTRFNLSAYQTDAEVKTTLVEGSVDIRSNQGRLRLSPGQQAVVNDQAGIVLNRNVNISEIVGWKEGYFRFNDKPISEILEELAKWYPIEDIQMQITSPDNFTGSIKRSKNLEDLLDAIASVSDLKFVVQGRRVIVMK